MAFFGNNAVNYLNLHYGIHSIALSGGGAFFMVYLLNSGVSAPAVFVSLAAILLGRFIMRPVVVGLSVRFGLRHMVAAGTLMSAVQYPLLAEVHGVGPALYWLMRCVGTSATRSTGRPTTPISPRSAMTSTVASRSARAKRSPRSSAS